MNKKPSYLCLHTFGYLCYGSTLPKTWTKFSPRVIPIVFHGYPLGYKGYKLIDLVTNSIFILRDVVFHESIFPFKTNSNVQPDMDIFVDTMLSTPSLNTSHPLVFGSNDPTSSLTPTSSSSCPSKLTKHPSYLRDYHYYLVTDSTNLSPHFTSHIWSWVLDYHRLSPSYKQFVCHLFSNVESTSLS